MRRARTAVHLRGARARVLAHPLVAHRARARERERARARSVTSTTVSCALLPAPPQEDVKGGDGTHGGRGGQPSRTSSSSSARSTWTATARWRGRSARFIVEKAALFKEQTSLDRIAEYRHNVEERGCPSARAPQTWSKGLCARRGVRMFAVTEQHSAMREHDAPRARAAARGCARRAGAARDLLHRAAPELRRVVLGHDDDRVARDRPAARARAGAARGRAAARHADVAVLGRRAEPHLLGQLEGRGARRDHRHSSATCT